LDASDPVNIELTRDYICAGYRVVDRESHEMDPQGNPRVFLNSMIGIVENGMLVRTWGIQRDITDRRRAEQERKRAEETLHESERNLADAQARAHLGSWVESLTDHKLIWSDELYRLWGLEPRSVEPNREIFLRGVHPEDRAHVQQALDGSLVRLRPFDCVHRVMRPDGSIRFAHAQGEAITNAQGQVVQFVGTVLDITEQKLAEKALASVTRRLFEAQEQERARIARELHDDINQRLAMLTIHLGQVQAEFPDLPAEVIRRIGTLKKESAEISSDIQSLSHELHLAKLEYLGITTAMKAFCKEFGTQQRVEIDFEIHEVPIDLPPDASLCLFRVLQEALHNSVKHSGVRHFEVRLREISDEVHLTVRDSGAGFDAKAAKQSQGLGLVSMEERLKLVNGTFSIESQSHVGTTIHARVPIKRASDSIRAAG
jgi:PAS domain S-box-containing protein